MVLSNNVHSYCKIPFLLSLTIALIMYISTYLLKYVYMYLVWFNNTTSIYQIDPIAIIFTFIAIAWLLDTYVIAYIHTCICVSAYL